MDSAFNSGHWGSMLRRPCYPQNYRAVPITTPQTTPSPSPSHKPKVVSIPVQFSKPEDCSMPKPGRKAKYSSSDCAIRIQKMWRGFRVRTNVKKIMEIEREVGEEEKTISDSGTLEVLRRDERERLKVNERLMDLLFRLDSIRGFDGAVKDLRKTVIRRAIVLQEKVDCIGVSVGNSVDQPMDDVCDAKSSCEHDVGQQNPDSESDSDSESCGTSPSLIGEREQSDAPEEKGEEELEPPVDRELGVVNEEKSNTTMEESTRKNEVLERMVEENNRLMKLMADLYEKSEMQTQILSSLSERVGQLENAFAWDKLWRMRAKKLKKNRISKSP